MVSWHRLQFGRIGFRIDGGSLHSFETESAALDALNGLIDPEWDAPSWDELSHYERAMILAPFHNTSIEY